MYFRAIAGMVAGLSAGVVSGILYLVMTVPQVNGSSVPLLSLLARLLGSMDVDVGWSFQLLNSTIAGMIYGVVFGPRTIRLGTALWLGLFMGLLWWAAGLMMVMPILQSTRGLFGPLNSSLRLVAIESIVASCVQGLVMGIIFRSVYLLNYPHETYPAHYPTTKDELTTTGGRDQTTGKHSS